jgi:DNA gyrase subunit B
MPALLENNFIYIARPPLFRVTRKKVSRYIHSEKEMDDYLIELGMSDLHFKLAGYADPLNAEEMKELLKAILDIESLILSIERKGVPFREFLSAKNAAGQLPRFRVKLGEELKFFYSEDEFAQIKAEHEALQKDAFERTLASIPEAEQTEEMKVFKPKALSFMELYDPQALHSLKEKLANFNLSLDSYLVAEGKLLDALDEGGHETPLFTLKESVEHLRANGRKGIEIQRYKGLGEMNADQLWETTMNPANRTLMKVTIPDAIAADHMFTMLMGEDVPPRRAFIEEHALSVKNLDI